MVDFRKWFMAFASAALLFGLGSSAYAQSTAFICNATAGNPHIVRQEGVAELVGDLILNCTGGSFTPAGTYMGPGTNVVSNVQINLNTNVTSRLTGNQTVTGTAADSEAILTIDEPFPNSGGQIPFGVNGQAVTGVAGAAQYQLGCVANGESGCLNIRSVGWGFGASGSYNGTPGHPNIFQGLVSAANPYQVNWQGVPIDAPGTTITRIIRITNVRANACALAGNTTSLLPTTITELIGISGSQSIIINTPLQTVALAEKGLLGSVNPFPQVFPPGPATYQQCNSLNAAYLTSLGGSPPTSLSNPSNPSEPPSAFLPVPPSGIPISTILLSATEGFAAAFKYVANYTNFFYGFEQNVLGISYFTESGWIPYDVSGLDQSSGREIGLADTGTLIQFTFTGIPAGVTDLFVPNAVNLVDPSGALTSGYAQLYTGVTPDSNPGPPTGVTDVGSSFVGGAVTVIYQIIYSDPTVVETLNVWVAPAYNTTSATSPAPSVTPTNVAINFAPLSTAPGATVGPIPRFCQPYVATAAFSLTACTCNLLFPFVTNQAGFDTGIAIANTSDSPSFGGLPPLVAQLGTLTLTYYGNTAGNGPPPPAYTTQAAVPPGSEVTFTLSSGGQDAAAPTISVPPTPTFQGYIIVQANFQFCHGFAAITDQGAQRLGEGYLALSLDVPGLNRTYQVGENEGH
jgi:hypothetical protein